MIKTKHTFKSNEREDFKSKNSGVKGNELN